MLSGSGEVGAGAPVQANSSCATMSAHAIPNALVAAAIPPSRLAAKVARSSALANTLLAANTPAAKVPLPATMVCAL